MRLLFIGIREIQELKNGLSRPRKNKNIYLLHLILYKNLFKLIVCISELLRFNYSVITLNKAQIRSPKLFQCGIHENSPSCQITDIPLKFHMNVFRFQFFNILLLVYFGDQRVYRILLLPVQ